MRKSRGLGLKLEVPNMKITPRASVFVDQLSQSNIQKIKFVFSWIQGSRSQIAINKDTNISVFELFSIQILEIFFNNLKMFCVIKVTLSNFTIKYGEFFRFCTTRYTVHCRDHIMCHKILQLLTNKCTKIMQPL